MDLADALWRKSTYSGSQTSCVEVAFAWNKSSYSGSQTECVEVGVASGVVGVRDTKDRDGGQLTVPASAWSAFLGRQRSS